VDRAKTKLRGSGFVELNRQFDTLVEQFQKHRAFGSGDHVIAVKAGGEIRVLKPDDIHWIEAQGDYLKFHTTGAHLISRETMQHFLARAPADRFLRVHKSTIVNVRAVRCIESIHAGDHRVRLCDGAEVRVSRLHRNQLHTLLGR
jgi:two-component system LytT family response regulator